MKKQKRIWKIIPNIFVPGVENSFHLRILIWKKVFAKIVEIRGKNKRLKMGGLNLLSNIDLNLAIG